MLKKANLNNMPDTEIKTPPPVDSAGMNIHMSYVRRDIDEIKVILKDIKNGYVSSGDFAEHVKISGGLLDDHEKRVRAIEENTSDIKTIKKLVYGVVGLILTTVVLSGIYFAINK